MPQAIIVVPQALPSGWYANSKDGARPVEDVMMKNLLPHIDATYRTIASAGGRGIEGSSMGGYGALRLGLKFPKVFGFVSGVGPSIRQTLAEEPSMRTADTFFGDEAYYEVTGPWGLARSNAAAIRAAAPAIRVLDGSNDDLDPIVKSFAALLTSLKIANTYQSIAGAGHDYSDILSEMSAPYAFWKTLGTTK